MHNISINYKDDKVVIDFKDTNKSTKIEFFVDKSDFFNMISKQQTDAECEVVSTSPQNLSKVKVVDIFEFEITDDIKSEADECYSLRKLAQRLLNESEDKKDWNASIFFDYDDTFFELDNKRYARCEIFKYE